MRIAVARLSSPSLHCRCLNGSMEGLRRLPGQLVVVVRLLTVEPAIFLQVPHGPHNENLTMSSLDFQLGPPECHQSEPDDFQGGLYILSTCFKQMYRSAVIWATTRLPAAASTTTRRPRTWCRPRCPAPPLPPCQGDPAQHGAEYALRPAQHPARSLRRALVRQVGTETIILKLKLKLPGRFLSVGCLFFQKRTFRGFGLSCGRRDHIPKMSFF
jgi:hypothetical protein